MTSQTLRSRRQGALSRRMRNITDYETARHALNLLPESEERAAKLAANQTKLDRAKADVRALQGKLA